MCRNEIGRRKNLVRMRISGAVTYAAFFSLFGIGATRLVPANYIAARAPFATSEWTRRIPNGLVRAVEDDEEIFESPTKGMTLDSCRVSEECTSPRNCIHIDPVSPSGQVPCDPSKKHCVCIRRGGGTPPDEFILCHESGNCEDGEVCARRNNITYAPYDTKMVPICASEAFVAGSSLWEEVNKLSGSGLAGDACKAPFQCKAPRTCFNITITEPSPRPFTPCNGYREQSNKCVCYSVPYLCRRKSHCNAGEVCAENKNKSRYPVCISEERFSYTSRAVMEADYENGTALTMEPCLTDAECVAPRSCISGQRLDQHCLGGENCFCLHFKRCTRSSDCPEGEICGVNLGRAISPAPYCFSELLRSTGLFVTVEEEPSLIQDGSDLVSQEPDPSSATDPIRRDVCIAAHHLHHLPREGLLFASHHISAVLCDSWDNCATRGHIVKYKNTPMMMMSYCAIVECTEKLMPVNAPAGFGTVVESRRADLQFTALSARYETRLEEIFLSHVLRSHIFEGSEWFRWYF